MEFYAVPKADAILPGDIFPDIPFPVITAPLRIVRPSPIQPKAKQAPMDLRQIFTMPGQPPPNLRLGLQEGEEAISQTRCSKALFLTWGSDVEDDERRFVERGRVGRKGWLAAPIYSLTDEIPENSKVPHPDTGADTPVRDLVREGKITHWFYLPPFPNVEPATEYFANLRDITNIGVQFFRETKALRVATLTNESFNELMSQLIWVFSRAEILFRPIRCECGRDVTIDVRFEGQYGDPGP